MLGLKLNHVSKSGHRPLLEPMLIYYQLGKFQWNLNQNMNFFPRKCIWKFCLQNVSHLIQASMCSAWMKVEQCLSRLKYWSVKSMGWANTNFLWVWPFGLSLCFSVIGFGWLWLNCLIYFIFWNSPSPSSIGYAIVGCYSVSVNGI